MVNLDKNQRQYLFSVNGGDVRSSQVGISGIVGIISILVGGYFFFGTQYIPPEYRIYVIVLIAVISLSIIAFWIQKLARGGMSRFVVKIDLETCEISTYDRIAMQNVWIAEFYPEYLQIAEIVLEINGEEFRYPALVYADQKLDFVEESVPYPDRAILGYAEREEIDLVLKNIQEEIMAL